MSQTIDVASNSALLSVAEKLERQNEILSGSMITIKGDNAYVRYSANEDGTDFTEEWSIDKKYIGFATAPSAPTNKEDYEWIPLGGEYVIEQIQQNTENIEKLFGKVYGAANVYYVASFDEFLSFKNGESEALDAHDNYVYVNALKTGDLLVIMEEGVSDFWFEKDDSTTHYEYFEYDGEAYDTEAYYEDNTVGAFHEMSDESWREEVGQLTEQIDALTEQMEAANENIQFNNSDINNVYNGLQEFTNVVSHLSQKGRVSGCAVVLDGVTTVNDALTVRVSSDSVEDLSSVTITKTGKNLFNTDALVELGGVRQEDGTIYFENVGHLKEQVVFKAPEGVNKVTFSYKVKTKTTDASSGARFRAYYKNGSYAIIGNVKGTEYQSVTWTSHHQQTIDRIVVDYGSSTNSTWLKDLQIEWGNSCTDYEHYTEERYVANSDGVVEGITCDSPCIVLISDTEDVLIECEYTKDINTEFNELKQAIIALGGYV